MNGLAAYAQKIPEEIKDAIKAVDNEIRYAIIECLLEEKQTYSYYPRLRQKLGISKRKLDYHLKELMLGGLVNNFSLKNFYDEHHSHYELSTFGKDFIGGLFQSLASKTDNKKRK